MDRKNVLIVSALEQETDGQLEGYRVLHTGVGKVNAAIKTDNDPASLTLQEAITLINMKRAAPRKPRKRKRKKK